MNSRYRNPPSGKTFRVLPILDTPPVSVPRGSSNAEWQELYEFVDINTSPTSKKTVPIAFDVEMKAQSFRSAIIEWGRKERECYDNGWRFTTHIDAPKSEGESFIVNVWKVPARKEDFRSRGNYKKRAPSI